jgi:hypothetical protein
MKFLCSKFDSRLLPVKENFLLRPIFKGCSSITPEDLDRVFQLYDKVKILIDHLYD